MFDLQELKQWVDKAIDEGNNTADIEVNRSEFDHEIVESITLKP